MSPSTKEKSPFITGICWAEHEMHLFYDTFKKILKKKTTRKYLYILIHSCDDIKCVSLTTRLYQ